VEDKNFYSHFGLDPIGILRAAFKILKAGRIVAGGSTITQQTAKNLFLTQERPGCVNLRNCCMPSSWNGNTAKMKY
jgi:membrane peptidoglycan carboxypeptidase